MHPSRLNLAEHIFADLVGAPPEQRARELAERCAADEELRTLVDQLLKNDDSGMAGFLSQPILRPERFASQSPARIGKYLIVREIGRGGAGIVYEARQSDPARSVALKVIGAGFGSLELRRRFAREAEFLGKLQHPGIAQIYEVGIAELGNPHDVSASLPYFAMELVCGDPVTTYCERARLTIAQRLHLFRDICDAVQHAHQRGIIHRDLKPSNVLVTLVGGRPLPKVIDFGIAKATLTHMLDDAQRTELHQLIGTPEYMSPEQADLSPDLDTRSDVYSLGVLLYELLTGATPLDGARLRAASFPEIQRLIRTQEPLRPSARALGSTTRPTSLARQLRGDLDWIVMKCLEKDRQARYPTVSALADDIGHHLDQQPVRARPPSPAYKLHKFVRRHRTGVLAGTATVAALVLGILGTSVGLVGALRAQRQTEQQRTIAQAEAQRANDAADQARAVNEFMREVLTSVDPDRNGADVRLIDVLAHASSAASHRFAGHPLQEAQVRELLGQVYDKLSLWDAAAAQFAQAVELWQQHVGPDDPRALVDELQYAGELINLSRIGEAEQVLGTLMPKLERGFGPDDPQTLKARRAVAVTLMCRGRLDEAEPILLALRVHPRLVDDDAVQVMILYNLVGLALRRGNTVDHAEELALLARAEPLARESVERSQRHFGPDSAFTLQNQVRFAKVNVALGQYAAAAETCRAILENRRLGECHSIRLEALNVLARASTGLGEDQQATELLLRELACLRQEPSTDPVNLLSALSELLRYLERTGRATEGEDLARELLAGLNRYGGGHGDMEFATELFLARFISMQDRLDEAEPLFQSLLAVQERVQDTRARARLHLFYGSHLMRRGLFPEAEQHLLAAAALLDDIRLGTWDTHPDDVIRGFIALYDRWGQPDQADEYRRLLAEPR